MPVDYTTQKDLVIEMWYVEHGLDLFPDALFDNDDHSRVAYNCLLEYQDSFGSGTESHLKVLDWARPQCVQPVANLNNCVACNALVRKPRLPPGLPLKFSDFAKNKGILAVILEKDGATLGVSDPPGLPISLAQQVQNRNAFNKIRIDMPRSHLEPNMFSPISALMPLKTVVVSSGASLAPTGLDLSAVVELKQDGLATTACLHEPQLVQNMTHQAAPGLGLTPAQMLQNRELLAAIPGHASTAAALNTSLFASELGEDQQCVPNSGAYQQTSQLSHMPDYLHNNAKPSFKSAGEIQQHWDPEKPTQDLKALLQPQRNANQKLPAAYLRPRNVAENSLLTLLNPANDGVLAEPSTRTLQEERLLAMIQRGPTFACL